jgi:regulator of protease activity HflC (stomatin/prohibitin superfamily)
MVEWLTQILDAITSFIPRFYLIAVGRMGVKHTASIRIYWKKWRPAVEFPGKAIALKPGLHIYWPLITEIEDYSVELDSMDIDIQTMLTADDVTVVVRCVLQFTIFDIIKARVRCNEFESTIVDLCAPQVALEISKWEYKENRLFLDDFNMKLKRSVGPKLRKYGIKAELFAIRDLAPARVLRNIRDVSSVKED